VKEVTITRDQVVDFSKGAEYAAVSVGPAMIPKFTFSKKDRLSGDLRSRMNKWIRELISKESLSVFA
jgi:hypothetical protein